MHNSNTPAPQGAPNGHRYAPAPGGLHNGLQATLSAPPRGLPQSARDAIDPATLAIVEADGVPGQLQQSLKWLVAWMDAYALLETASGGAAGITATRAALALAQQRISEAQTDLSEEIVQYKKLMRDSLADLETLEQTEVVETE